MKTIQTLWKELEDWFNQNTDLSFNFNDPASEQEIEDTEKKLGIKFPDDFRETLLLFNGQKRIEDPQAIWMPGCGPLLSLKNIMKQWELDRDGDSVDEGTSLNGYLSNNFIDPKRIPIASDPFGDGIVTYLDFIPGPNGKAGQLITLVTECDFVVLDESLHKALERYIELLKSGEICWSDDEETLMMKSNNSTAEELAEAFALVK